MAKERITYGYKEGPISVHFKTGIGPDGDLMRVYISKDGQEVSLSQAQAQTLAQYLLRKFGTQV